MIRCYLIFVAVVLVVAFFFVFRGGWGLNWAAGRAGASKDSQVWEHLVQRHLPFAALFDQQRRHGRALDLHGKVAVSPPIFSLLKFSMVSPPN